MTTIAQAAAATAAKHKQAQQMNGAGTSGPVVYESYLSKKSPSGIPGMRLWQKRWFVLKSTSLLYFKAPDSRTPQGVIPFETITSVALHPTASKEGRFDITATDRLYSLKANALTHAQAWVKAIQDTVFNSKARTASNSISSTDVDRLQALSAGTGASATATTATSAREHSQSSNGGSGQYDKNGGVGRRSPVIASTTSTDKPNDNYFALASGSKSPERSPTLASTCTGGATTSTSTVPPSSLNSTSTSSSTSSSMPKSSSKDQIKAPTATVSPTPSNKSHSRQHSRQPSRSRAGSGSGSGTTPSSLQRTVIQRLLASSATVEGKALSATRGALTEQMLNSYFATDSDVLRYLLENIDAESHRAMLIHTRHDPQHKTIAFSFTKTETTPAATATTPAPASAPAPTPALTATPAPAPAPAPAATTAASASASTSSSTGAGSASPRSGSPVPPRSGSPTPLLPPRPPSINTNMDMTPRRTGSSGSPYDLSSPLYDSPMYDPNTYHLHMTPASHLQSKDYRPSFSTFQLDGSQPSPAHAHGSTNGPSHAFSFRPSTSTPIMQASPAPFHPSTAARAFRLTSDTDSSTASQPGSGRTSPRLPPSNPSSNPTSPATTATTATAADTVPVPVPDTPSSVLLPSSLSSISDLALAATPSFGPATHSATIPSHRLSVCISLDNMARQRQATLTATAAATASAPGNGNASGNRQAPSTTPTSTIASTTTATTSTPVAAASVVSTSSLSRASAQLSPSTISAILAEAGDVSPTTQKRILPYDPSQPPPPSSLPPANQPRSPSHIHPVLLMDLQPESPLANPVLPHSLTTIVTSQNGSENNTQTHSSHPHHPSTSFLDLNAEPSVSRTSVTQHMMPVLTTTVTPAQVQAPAPSSSPSPSPSPTPPRRGSMSDVPPTPSPSNQRNRRILSRDSFSASHGHGRTASTDSVRSNDDGVIPTGKRHTRQLSRAVIDMALVNTTMDDVLSPNAGSRRASRNNLTTDGGAAAALAADTASPDPTVRRSSRLAVPGTTPAAAAAAADSASEKTRRHTQVLSRLMISDLTQSSDFNFIRALLEVFEQEDQVARGLAVRVLWIIMQRRSNDASKRHSLFNGSIVHGGSIVPSLQSVSENDSGITTGLPTRKNNRAFDMIQSRSMNAFRSKDTKKENEDGTMNGTTGITSSSSASSTSTSSSTTIANNNDASMIETFANYIQLYCSGSRLCPSICNSLLHILMNSADVYTKQLDRHDRVGLKMPVRNPGVWKALFYALADSDLDLREAVLLEINTILIDNPDNCESLRSQKDWQLWVFPLLRDLPMSVASSMDPAIRAMMESTSINISPATRTMINIYNMTINILTLQAYDALMRLPTTNAIRVITRTIDLLNLYNTMNGKSQYLLRTLLMSLLSKLESNRLNFAPGMMMEACSWRNLFPFLGVVKRFIFQTGTWKATETGPIKGNDLYICDQNMPVGASLSLAMGKDVSFKFADTNNPGVHATDDDVCVDGILCDRACSLLRALQFHSFDPSVHPNLSHAERDYLLAGREEHSFFVDAAVFMQLLLNIKGNDSAVSKSVHAFLNAKNGADRRSVLNNVGQTGQKSKWSSSKYKTLRGDHGATSPLMINTMASPTLGTTSQGFSPIPIILMSPANSQQQQQQPQSARSLAAQLEQQQQQSQPQQATSPGATTSSTSSTSSWFRSAPSGASVATATVGATPSVGPAVGPARSPPLQPQRQGANGVPQLRTSPILSAFQLDELPKTARGLGLALSAPSSNQSTPATTPATTPSVTPSITPSVTPTATPILSHNSPSASTLHPTSPTSNILAPSPAASPGMAPLSASVLPSPAASPALTPAPNSSPRTPTNTTHAPTAVSAATSSPTSVTVSASSSASPSHPMIAVGKGMRFKYSSLKQAVDPAIIEAHAEQLASTGTSTPPVIDTSSNHTSASSSATTSPRNLSAQASPSNFSISMNGVNLEPTFRQLQISPSSSSSVSVSSKSISAVAYHHHDSSSSVSLPSRISMSESTSRSTVSEKESFVPEVIWEESRVVTTLNGTS